MKYPEKQYRKLVDTLKVLSNYFDNLREVNPHALHFLVYQQHNEGQRHNAFVLLNNGTLSRAGRADELNVTKQLFEQDNDFELYPTGCNDNHIETAMKHAIKEI